MLVRMPAPVAMLFFSVVLVIAGPSAWAESSAIDTPSAPLAGDMDRQALESLASLRAQLSKQLTSVRKQITAAGPSADLSDLRKHEQRLKEDYLNATKNFEEVAAGFDVSALRKGQSETFDLKSEFMQLLEPTLKAIKGLTSEVRKKSALKEQIEHDEDKLKIADKAILNIQRRLEDDYGRQVKAQLKEDLEAWRQERQRIESSKQSAEIQLRKLESQEVPLTQATGNYFKEFFQRRGFYLGQAVLAVVLILLLSKATLRLMEKFVGSFRAHRRSFRVRLFYLLHRLLTLVAVIIGPMIVFYLAEDWLLFSVGLLLLFALGWTMRGMIPRYWRQMQIFLNVGPVREGERITLDGMPWRVKEINVFTILENPKIKLRQRIPIGELVDMRSRPVGEREPWFPCNREDWVLLSDGKRGKVVGISTELVELVDRGGSRITYNTPDFLAQSPCNLSTSFRLKETIGISYDLQKQSTSEIPVLLEQHVRQRISDEGYGDALMNLRVEFEKADTSSLNIVVIADFRGDLADIYNRLRRSMQRWCVDACGVHGWEIPFTQLTLHSAD